MGLGGFFIGGIGGGPKGSVLGFLWGGSIGYGLGSIVNTKQATKRVVVYWGLTLALVGTFFGLVIGAPVEPSIAKETVAGVLGAVAGMVFGSVIGVIQLWGLRRKSQAPRSDSVV